MEFTVHKSQGSTLKEVTMHIDDADYQTRDLGFFPCEFWTKRIKELSEKRHARLILDMDQVYSAHGAVTEEERAALHDKVLNLPRPDLHISGEDPDPYGRAVKAYSWAPDEIRLEILSEKTKEVREQLEALVIDGFEPLSCYLAIKGDKDLGFPDLVLFDYPDSRSFPSEEDQARLDDTWEQLRQAAQKPQRIAITGCPSGEGVRGVMEKLGVEKDYYIVDVLSSCMGDTWKAVLPSEAELRIFKPNREWDQPKLRRGKGHNKFKRKGKK